MHICIHTVYIYIYIYIHTVKVYIYIYTLAIRDKLIEVASRMDRCRGLKLYPFSDCPFRMVHVSKLNCISASLRLYPFSRGLRLYQENIL